MSSPSSQPAAYSPSRRRWGVGHSYENICLDLDLRVGGVLYHRVRAKETGTPWIFFGAYYEIEPLRRLVYGFDWKHDWRQPASTSRVELDFAERNGATRLQIVHADLIEPAIPSTKDHWSEFLNLLDELLGSGELR